VHLASAELATNVTFPAHLLPPQISQRFRTWRAQYAPGDISNRSTPSGSGSAVLSRTLTPRSVPTPQQQVAAAGQLPSSAGSSSAGGTAAAAPAPAVAVAWQGGTGAVGGPPAAAGAEWGGQGQPQPQQHQQQLQHHQQQLQQQRQRRQQRQQAHALSARGDAPAQGAAADGEAIRRMQRSKTAPMPFADINQIIVGLMQVGWGPGRGGGGL
jgi:hypothetical protein